MSEQWQGKTGYKWVKGGIGYYPSGVPYLDTYGWECYEYVTIVYKDVLYYGKLIDRGYYDAEVFWFVCKDGLLDIKIEDAVGDISEWGHFVFEMPKGFSKGK